MGSSVQFEGINRVVEAYEMREAKYWAIFAGKNLWTRGDGEVELQNALEFLSKDGSNAIYTLKVYDEETVKDASAIKQNTGCDGAFNFKLFSGEGSRDSLYFRNRELEAQLAELKKQQEEGEEEDESILGKIGHAALNMLQTDPERLIGLVRGLKDLISAPNAPQVIGNVVAEFAKPVPAKPVEPVQKVNSTMENNSTNKNIPVTEEEKINRLSSALDRLEKNDPLLLVHLEKLAELSEKNKQMFDFLLKNLDTM